jgi:hypothetical protein
LSISLILSSLESVFPKNRFHFDASLVQKHFHAFLLDPQDGGDLAVIVAYHMGQPQ